jgi:hypothetical protein
MFFKALMNLFLWLLARARWLVFSSVLASVAAAPLVVMSGGLPFVGATPASPVTPSLPLPSAALPLALALGLYVLVKRSLR